MSYLLFSLDVSPGDVLYLDWAKVCGGGRGGKRGLVEAGQEQISWEGWESSPRHPDIWK